jgi:hypothetical protein
MYFVVYKLYYVGQNDDLGIRARLRNWDEGSSSIRGRGELVNILSKQSSFI